MKFTKKFTYVLTLIIFSMTVLLGGITSTAANINEITIGYFPNITHAPAIVGIEQEIFTENLQGINIKTKIFPNGSLFMNALNTGQIDIGYVGPGPAINRFLQGAKVKSLASASTGGTVLVTRKDLKYNSVEDLKDKVVATAALGCTHDLLLRQLIKGHDMTTTRRGGTIDHRTQKPATMVGLFATEQLDAAMVSEPWAARMEKKLNNKVVVEWDEVPWKGNLPATLVVTNNKFADNNQELVRNFLKAHLASIEFIKENPNQTAKILQKEIKNITRQKLDINVIKRSLKRTNIDSNLDKNVVQELADLSAELGFIKGDSDLNGFVDTSLMEDIKSEKSK